MLYIRAYPCRFFWHFSTPNPQFPASSPKQCDCMYMSIRVCIRIIFWHVFARKIHRDIPAWSPKQYEPYPTTKPAFIPPSSSGGHASGDSGVVYNRDIRIATPKRETLLVCVCVKMNLYACMCALKYVHVFTSQVPVIHVCIQQNDPNNLK